MKKTIRIIGIIAIVAIIGLSMAGCATNNQGTASAPSDTGKTIRIDGTARELELFSESTGANKWPPFAIAGKDGNRDVNDPTNLYYVVEWVQRWDWWELPNWTGTGKFYILFEGPPKDPSRDGGKYVYSEDGINPTAVEIKEAITTLQLSKFIWFEDINWG